MKPPIDVLVVEDDEQVCRMLVRGLRRYAGLHVHAVPSCERAWELVERFDVGVFDVHLGDGSGIELAARMKADGRVRRVVFFTAGVTELELAAACRHGLVVDKAQGVKALLEVLLARA